MKYVIAHECRGRIRIRIDQKHMSLAQADLLEAWLQRLNGVQQAVVHERTCCAVIRYSGTRADLLQAISRFRYDAEDVETLSNVHSGRAISRLYQEKLVDLVCFKLIRMVFFPQPLRILWTIKTAVPYVFRGLRCLLRGQLHVELLDGLSIAVSILRMDFSTADSVMFLLRLGELLEEWTHKKSVDDLARCMSLNVDRVWLKTPGDEVLVPLNQVRPGDLVCLRMGNLIPLDGTVAEGEVMVNQASLTGESVPVRRTIGNYVYAGTVVEEGEVTINVKAVGGSSRYEKIAAMIEDSEKLKSGLESRAEHLADKLVPYSLGGTALTWLLTRNTTKALSILMVDFSCALKLAMPISVLSAIREAGMYKITVKGGKYLEAVAEADTIVFDKTGTLTKAKPTVAKVVSFNEMNEDELLRIAACLEEHFPHSMAKAVVSAAKAKHLDHEEMHSKVEYIVAHGISTQIEGKKAVIGSYHFVFEDEKVIIPDGKKEQFDNLPEEYSHLYMAIEGKLAAVICIEDPLREEAAEVIKELREAGLSKIVMMTGDSERTAKAIAKRVGVDEYYAEVLPEDKASFCDKEKAAGRKVIMIGDGINDSPALSAANVGIAISDGAELAREIADITVGADNLRELVTLKKISNGLIKRISHNYHTIVGFNAGLIALGVCGVIMPTTSALLHNTSTLLIGLKSMQNLLDE